MRNLPVTYKFFVYEGAVYPPVANIGDTPHLLTWDWILPGDEIKGMKIKRIRRSNPEDFIIVGSSPEEKRYYVWYNAPESKRLRKWECTLKIKDKSIPKPQSILRKDG